MELTGRICGVSRDYYKNQPILSLRINEEPNGIEDFNDKDLKLTISKITKPRSLNANAYFHVLCDKLRQKIGVSMAAMKNELITSYGQIEYLEEGKSLVYKTNAPPEYIRELEEAHMKFLYQADDGGYWYRVFRGSHTYNSREMSILLEGTISEAKEQGIETKTPNEIARLVALWEGVKHD